MYSEIKIKFECYRKFFSCWIHLDQLDKTCLSILIIVSSLSFLLEHIMGDTESPDPEFAFYESKKCVPGLILSLPPYLKSALGRLRSPC